MCWPTSRSARSTPWAAKSRAVAAKKYLDWKRAHHL
jgi:hypothetical protein